jgi:hypothetical protein
MAEPADPRLGSEIARYRIDERVSRSREAAPADADETLATPFSPLQPQVKLRKLLGADAVAV